MKNRAQSFWVTLLLPFLFFMACTKSEPKQDELPNETSLAQTEAITSIKDPGPYSPPDIDQNASLEEKYRFLAYNENYLWNAISFQESEKYADIDRLIQEISFNEAHLPTDLQEAKKLSSQLKNLFLSRADIADPSKIKNDVLNDSLISQIFAIGDSTTNMEGYLTFTQLKKEIVNRNSDTIVKLRNKHFEAVNTFNEFKAKFKNELQELNLESEPSKNWASE